MPVEKRATGNQQQLRWENPLTPGTRPVACYPIPCGLPLSHGRDTGGIKSGKGGTEMKWIKYTHAWNSIKNKNNQINDRKERNTTIFNLCNQYYSEIQLN